MYFLSTSLFTEVLSHRRLILSENLPSTSFSDVTSETNLRMWYSFRLDKTGCGICLSMDTSTYWHRDARYSRPSRQHKALDEQKHFITPRQHRHVRYIVWSVSFNLVSIVSKKKQNLFKYFLPRMADAKTTLSYFLGPTFIGNKM